MLFFFLSLLCFLFPAVIYGGSGMIQLTSTVSITQNGENPELYFEQYIRKNKKKLLIGIYEGYRLSLMETKWLLVTINTGNILKYKSCLRIPFPVSCREGYILAKQSTHSTQLRFLFFFLDM